MCYLGRVVAQGVLWLVISLLAGCKEKPPSEEPLVSIGTFDYRQISVAEINAVLLPDGISGVGGDAGRVQQFLVPSGKAAAAVRILRERKLPGLRLNDK